MKSNWKECTIADLGEVIGGATPSTKNIENYENGDISWITPKDLSTHNNRYIYYGERNITKIGLNSCSTKILPKNSVLFSSRAPIGYVAIAGKEMCTNQGFKSVVPNFNTNYMFLYYLLKYNKENIENMGSGTTFKEVSGNTMKSIKVYVPTNIETQKKIASILSALDDKIELNNKINENLEMQAQAIFKSWFVDFEPFGGVMPEDWKVGKLKDILRLKKNTIKAGENLKLPYLPIDIIPTNTFALSSVKPNEEAKSSLITFNKDDILIGAMRVYFHRVTIAPFDGITRTTCFTLEPYNKEYLSFSLLYCNQEQSINYAQKTSKGSTMPYAIWEGGLGDMNINLPTRDIVKKFNNIILPLLRKIQNSYFENDYLTKLRNTLLPKLMNGEIDVDDVQVKE